MDDEGSSALRLMMGWGSGQRAYTSALNVSRWIRQVPLDPFILRLFYSITHRCKKGLRIPRLNHYLGRGDF